jgi:signal peptidase I
MTPHAKRKLIHYWRRQIRPILILVLVFTSFRSSIADWNDVPSGSMEPTIFTGDRIFVNKLAYGLKFPFTTWHLKHWSAPKRGEIVVFYSPQDGTQLVKRVVGIPGDHVVYHDGRLTINGQDLTYTPYAPPDFTNIPAEQQRNYDFYQEQLGDVRHVVALLNDATLRRLRAEGRGAPIRDCDYTVPPDHYFMMGDNRDNSKDSRYIGMVDRDLIRGRANRIIFSLDYDDHFLPRKSRFFHELH